MITLRHAATTLILVAIDISVLSAFVLNSPTPSPFIATTSSTSRFVATTSTTENTKSKSPIFEHLKFDGSTPTFDVLEKTKKYVETQGYGNTNDNLYDTDYVLRGPVIGPINRADLAATSGSGLGLQDAFPDIRIDSFGFSVDPENPYRCLYFQRWRAVHSGDLNAFGTVYPATNTEMEAPLSVFSVVWTPQGKIIYEQVGAVVDRIEGNTQGKAAVFGLLHTAGLNVSGSPGDFVFKIAQRIGHALGQGRSWSKEEDIPKWWTSGSRGADETEQY